MPGAHIDSICGRLGGGGDGGGGVVATDEIPMFIHGAPNKAIADVYLERRAVIIIIINHILS